MLGAKRPRSPTKMDGKGKGNSARCQFNSLRQSDAYMHQWTRPSLVQIMACRLVSTKPLSEPILLISNLGTNFSQILSKILYFLSMC